MPLYCDQLIKIEKDVAFFGAYDTKEPDELMEVTLTPRGKDKLRSHIGATLYFLVGLKGELLGFTPEHLWCDLQELKESNFHDVVEDVDTETDKRDDLIDTLHDQNK